MVGWLVGGWLVGWLLGCLVAWWLVVGGWWLVGWLVGWWCVCVCVCGWCWLVCVAPPPPPPHALALAGDNQAAHGQSSSRMEGAQRGTGSHRIDVDEDGAHEVPVERPSRAGRR